MILYLNHYRFVFILILVLHAHVHSLSGESKIRDVDDQFQINTEEILRRRKLIEPYLLDTTVQQKDWIETYHLSFSAGENPPIQKLVSKGPDLIKHPVRGKISSLDLIKETSKQEHPENDIVYFQQFNIDGKMQEASHADKVSYIASKASPLDPVERERRHKIVEDFTPELKNVERGIETGRFSGSIKDRTGSGSTSKLAEKQIFLNDDIKEMVSETKFPLETVVINEPRFVETKSKVVDSLEGKETSLKWRGNEHLSGLSKIDLNPTDDYHCLVGNMKESFHHIVKEFIDIKDFHLKCHKAALSYEMTNKKVYDTNNPIFNFRDGKESQESDYLVSAEELHIISEELQKQKRVLSFLSSLNQGKENWKETYHHAYDATNSKRMFKSAFSDFTKEENRNVLPNIIDVNENFADVLEHLLIQERLYFDRWLKKLLNKFDNHLFTERISISFSFTRDSLNNLILLLTPEKYDNHKADELISDLIFNANVHSDYNLSGLYDSYATIGFYIIVSIILSVLVFFILLHYPLSRIIFFVIICILWHGFKMYQEKIAEKHATVSGSSSAYCESILTKDSGVFTHIKEFIRYNVYNDHCEKYFNALMIDPISELSVSIVISDFVSSTFFQVFQPMGRMLNVLVKEMFKGLGFFQVFYLFVLLICFFMVFIVLILIYNKYKLILPYFMGSVEPSVTHCGSRVEDIVPKPSVIKDSVLKSVVSKNSDMLDVNHTKLSISIKVTENDCQDKISKSLMRRSSL